MPSNARGLGVTTMGPTARRGETSSETSEVWSLRGSAADRERLLQECALLPRCRGRISFSELWISHEISPRVFVFLVESSGRVLGWFVFWGNGRIWRIAGCQCRRSMSQSSTETYWDTWSWRLTHMHIVRYYQVGCDRVPRGSRFCHNHTTEISRKTHKDSEIC